MTTDRVLGMRRAQAAARSLNKRFGVRSAADIQIERFAVAKGLAIVEGRLDGAVARLVAGKKPVIRVSDRVDDVGERRFCIAHELGHWVLDHDAAEIEAACKHERPIRPVRAGDERHPEAEANTFSACSLMPQEQVGTRIERARPSLDEPYAISKEYTVPLCAGAIRFAEITPERCCAVYSERGKVVWAVPSATFTAKIERGTRLDRASVAWDYHHRKKIDDRAQPIAADAWIRTDVDVEIVEHSAVAPGAGGVITMLWVPEPVAAKLKMLN